MSWKFLGFYFIVFVLKFCVIICNLMVSRNYSQMNVKEDNNTSDDLLISLPFQTGLTFSQNSVPLAETGVRWIYFERKEKKSLKEFELWYFKYFSQKREHPPTKWLFKTRRNRNNFVNFLSKMRLENKVNSGLEINISIVLLLHIWNSVNTFWLYYNDFEYLNIFKNVHVFKVRVN